MKNCSRLFVFQLTVVTLLFALGCSKKEDPEAIKARNAEFDQKLNSLAVDVDIDKFHQLLGEPAAKKQREIVDVTMTIRRHARPKKVEERFTYTDYLYTNDHFYVQAVTDEAGKVGMYSITAKNSDYQPTLQTVMGKPIHLGKTVYADFSPTARKIAADFSGGADKPSYYEVVVSGFEDPKVAVVSTNPLGTPGKVGKLSAENGETLIKWFSLAGNDFPLNEEHDEFRKNTTINTYTAVAPWFRGVDNSADGANFGDSKINFGPTNSALKK